MVEITLSPYMYDDIPLVQASLVTIDGELTEIDADHVIVEVDDFHPIASQTATGTDPAAMYFTTSVGEERADASQNHISLSIQSNLSSVGGGCPCVRESPSINETSLPDERSGSSTFYSVSGTLPPVDPQEQARTFGAGAAGAAIGMMFGGPLLSVVLGIGAAFYSQQEGATGDVARALGDIAIMARVRFLELDAKHHLVEKGQEAVTRILRKLKHKAEKNPEAKVKVKRFVGWCWRALVEFENQHKLIQRGSIKAKEHLDSLVAQYSLSNSGTTIIGQVEGGSTETGTDSASRQ
jgi:hypothetical protein